MTKLSYIKFITSRATRGFSGLKKAFVKFCFSPSMNNIFSYLVILEIHTVVTAILYNTKTVNRPNIPFYCGYHCIHLTYAIRIRRDDLQYFSVSNLKIKQKHELTNQNFDIVSIRLNFKGY